MSSVLQKNFKQNFKGCFKNGSLKFRFAILLLHGSNKIAKQREGLLFGGWGSNVHSSLKKESCKSVEKVQKGGRRSSAKDKMSMI